jgi:hypothetical protein
LLRAFEHYTAQEEAALQARTRPAVEGAMRGLEDELQELGPKQTPQPDEMA